jgi:hypothetical protein
MIWQTIALKQFGLSMPMAIIIAGLVSLVIFKLAETNNNVALWLAL